MSAHPSVRHALVLLGTLLGIAGMGFLWNGVVEQNAGLLAIGAVLAVGGLLWCGRELGRSMDAARASRAHAR
jgi:protein-S-isoprenylcysteine O-methyltransferase Ste14